MNKKQKLIVVLGPTASGKTSYAINEAKQNNAAIVSADSRQVYAGMNIGTATPLRSANWQSHEGQAPHDMLTPDIIQDVPHYLLNIRRPDNPMSLAQWQGAAFEVIDSLLAQNQPVILAGGTMLYIDSIVKNYSIPNVPPNKALRDRKGKLENRKLYDELLRKDPDAADFIEPHNTQRILRALEVIEATGKPFSDQRKSRPPRYKTELIGLFPGWDELKERISIRSAQMFADGLVQETKNLQEEYGEDLQLLQTLGYKQAAAVLLEEISESDAIEDLTRATYKYARRQMSWWRGRDEITWV